MDDTAVKGRATAPDISARAFAVMTGPIWLANVTNIGAACIDTAMAGHLSANDLAAVGIGSSAMVAIVVTLMGITQAVSPVAGQHYGARRYSSVGASGVQMAWIVAVLSVLGILGLSAHSFWTAFSGAKGPLAQMLCQYLNYAAWGVPAALLVRVFTCLNVSVSRPLITTAVSALTVAVRIPCNWALMHGAWGAPCLGGVGAGLTSALCSWLTLALFAGIWIADRHLRVYWPERLELPDPKAIGELLRIGIPIGVSSFCMVACYRAMGIILGHFGAETAAANQVVASIDILVYATPSALALTTCTLVAQSIGAGSAQTAGRAARRGVAIGLALCFVQAVLLATFRMPFISVFTSVPEVAAIAGGFITFAAAYHTADGSGSIAAMALRGYKVTFLPMLVQCACLGVIGMGGGLLLSFDCIPFWHPGPKGFWIAFCSGTVVAAAAIITLMVRVARLRAREA